MYIQNFLHSQHRRLHAFLYQLQAICKPLSSDHEPIQSTAQKLQEMAQKSLAITILLLRILTLALLVVSLVILVTVRVKDADPDTGENLTFKYFYTYRYVLSVDAIGGAYMLVHILFSVISLITGTYFGSKLHIWLHQFFDLVFALFFASGVGAGFWLTYDVKRELGPAVAFVPGLNKYFNLVYVSSGILLAATLSTGAIILSSTYVLGRYLLSVDAIGGAYALVQILFSVISLITGTYFGSKLHIWLRQFFDLAFALYFASGVGAGFWVTFEFKEKAGSAVDLLVPGLNKFLNLVYVSSGFLLLATISATAIILVSAFASTRK